MRRSDGLAPSGRRDAIRLAASGSAAAAAHHAEAEQPGAQQREPGRFTTTTLPRSSRQPSAIAVGMESTPMTRDADTKMGFAMFPACI
jgi:hypothetical protein